MTTTTPQRLRPDAVERQLKAIARQGAHSASLSHLAAMALIVLFSLGSLVSLSGDALASILRQWHATGSVDVVAAIGVGVSTLVVICMDMAMLRAASVLRMLAARRASPAEKRGHQAMLYAVAVVEASTYAYMSVLYDAPHSLAAWAIILARAGMAPIVAVYLSMARPLPVERRDILAQAALASGAGVLRDVVTVANDASAPLARKVALYKAADADTQGDAQLDRMIAALAPDASPLAISGDTSITGEALRLSDGAYTAPQDGPHASDDTPRVLSASDAPAPLQRDIAASAVGVRTGDMVGVRTHADASASPDETPSPPTGPGSPTTASTRRQRQRTPKPSQPRSNVLRLTPDRDGLRRAAQERQSLEAVARDAFAAGATSIAKMREATGMSQSAAQSYVRMLKAESAATTAGQHIMPAPTLPGMASTDAAEGYAL